MSNIITMNSIILRGIPLTEGSNSLLEVAKLTGDPMELTYHDALGAAILKSTSESVRKELVTMLKSEGAEGVSRIMKSLPKEGQQDIERQARRFMTDAKALIEIMGTGNKQAPTEEPEEVCDEYMVSMNLAFEPVYNVKCGLSLKGIPRNDQTKKLFEMALAYMRTRGANMILSKEDALKQAIVDAAVSKAEAAAEAAGTKNPHGYTSEHNDPDSVVFGGRYYHTSGPVDLMKEETEKFIEREGTAKALAQLPEQERIAIQKQAERFMEDAKALIRRLKK